MPNWIKRLVLPICFLQETHLKCYDINKLQVKNEKSYIKQTLNNTANTVILISEKVDNKK